MNKSNLNTLLFYAADKGMDSLYMDFKSQLNKENMYTDHSKVYDEEEKVIYLFPGIYDEEQTLLMPDYQSESKPYTFESHVKSKVQRELNRYLNWLNELFETNKPIESLPKIVRHKQKITALFNSIDDNKTLPRIALKKAQKHLNDYYQILTTGETLEQQKEKVTKIKIYERYWELVLGPDNMSRGEAFRSIHTWLTDELQFTESEVNNKLIVNLSEVYFKRNADNQKNIRREISIKYSTR